MPGGAIDPTARARLPRPVPEGPTVARWAEALRALEGQPLVSVEAPRRWRPRTDRLVGSSIGSVESRGKHLLLHLSTGDTIHAHALQYGSWDVGTLGLPLRKEPRFIRLRLRTATHDAVYYHGPVMEVLSPSELLAHEALAALGPDLMRHDFDAREARRRLATAGERPIGDALLDQRLVAGIGNIFKSEGLFLAGIDPRRATRGVSARDLTRLWRRLVPVMHESARQAGPTATLPPARREGRQRHWVYRRRGHACFECGTAIAMERQGEFRRATWYCPSCQR